MCGIFGVISTNKVDEKKLNKLTNHSKQRGNDSSGCIAGSNEFDSIKRAD
jgi:glucosamine 6-phosphate synthetase-like amidotransferase/phosphosugar isomerase protein